MAEITVKRYVQVEMTQAEIDFLISILKDRQEVEAQFLLIELQDVKLREDI